MKIWWKPYFLPLSRDASAGCGLPPLSLVDAHVHVFPPDLIRRREACLGSDPRFDSMYSAPKARMATVEEVLEHMDESGAELSIIFGFAFRDQGLCRETNDYVIEAVRSDPSRLAGLACVSTASPDAVKELERCLDAGLRGCGELAPASGDHEELSKLAPIAHCLGERGLPLMVHASEPVGHEYPGKGRFTPEACVALARTYPGLDLVLSHLGGGVFLYELMPEVRESLARVCYDTAAAPYLYSSRVYEVALLAVGPKKLIFGSDYPLLQPMRYAKELEHMSPEHQEAVRAGNARRVFKL
jgi:predicted TIM-barrel fold metal-dependent hydrolase